ncbi:unnamed protein product [Prorocentrum cordatum]|uniref:Uncharacterized protein n=1 Tax=Prorocentrum cordatum TaxID=2364126 RepID=A0ABN9SKP9_9DINO|nr:unnamed protein product [Polarella glacialis]
MMKSVTFNRAVDALVAVQRLPGGDTHLNGMAIRLISNLDRGGDWDWDDILYDAQLWEIAGVQKQDARQAFEGVIKLCGTGDAPSSEFQVESRDGPSLKGFIAGQQVALRLEQSSAELGWGDFSRYVRPSRCRWPQGGSAGWARPKARGGGSGERVRVSVWTHRGGISPGCHGHSSSLNTSLALVSDAESFRTSIAMSRFALALLTSGSYTSINCHDGRAPALLTM